MGKHLVLLFAIPVLFQSVSWAGVVGTGPSFADACVKVRNGPDSFACMKFSASEKRAAEKYGLRLGAAFKDNKRALLKRGWVLDKQGMGDDGAALTKDEEMHCGSGLDAVCQAAFKKNDALLVLTLSGVKEGTPLVATEVVEGRPSAPALDRTLETPSFLIRITDNCVKRDANCHDVAYLGTSKKTGKGIKLRGKRKQGGCVDGVVPCAPQGYAFWNGHTYYEVSDDGSLSVLQQEKILLKERGSWK